MNVLEADHVAIPPDARWITVHPNGPGSKGQSILFLLLAAGKDGTVRVIGGEAGRRLNMLQLRGVKSEAHYKAEAVERQAAKRKARKDSIAADHKLGLHEAKQKARGELFEQTRKARMQFVNAVASALGWDQSFVALIQAGHSWRRKNGGRAMTCSKTG